MPSATLDTNIYVSALVYRGTPLRLLHLAIGGDLDVAISSLELPLAGSAAFLRRDYYYKIRVFFLQKAILSQG